MTEPRRLTDKRMRLKAFALHLGLSAVILLAALAMVHLAWFPGPYLQLGGYEGLWMLAAVTLVAGPVLTLVIFNPGKKTVLIKLDLVIIAAVQAACVGFGLWSIYQQRPAVEVLADDGIYVHPASELAAYGMAAPAIEGHAPPKRYVLDLPEGDIRDLKLVHEIINRKPFSLSDELLVTIANADVDIDRRIAAINAGLSTRQRDSIDSLKAVDDCRWLPLYSIHGNGVGCYSPASGVQSIILDRH